MQREEMKLKTEQCVWLWFLWQYFMSVELKIHRRSVCHLCVCVYTCRENDNKMGQCGHSHAV